MPLHVDVGDAEGTAVRQGGAGALDPSRDGGNTALPAAQGTARPAVQGGQDVPMPGPSGPGLLACALPAPPKREPVEPSTAGCSTVLSRDPRVQHEESGR